MPTKTSSYWKNKRAQGKVSIYLLTDENLISLFIKRSSLSLSLSPPLFLSLFLSLLSLSSLLLPIDTNFLLTLVSSALFQYEYDSQPGLKKMLGRRGPYEGYNLDWKPEKKVKQTKSNCLSLIHRVYTKEKNCVPERLCERDKCLHAAYSLITMQKGCSCDDFNCFQLTVTS